MEKKFMRIATNGVIEILDLDQERDLLDVIHEQLDGGFFEIVRCPTLSHRFLMLVDDCGAIKDLHINPVASEMYGWRQHGSPIFGVALFMKEAIVDGEHDIVGLDSDDVVELIRKMRGVVVIKDHCYFD